MSCKRFDSVDWSLTLVALNASSRPPRTSHIAFLPTLKYFRRRWCDVWDELTGGGGGGDDKWAAGEGRCHPGSQQWEWSSSPLPISWSSTPSSLSSLSSLSLLSFLSLLPLSSSSSMVKVVVLRGKHISFKHFCTQQTAFHDVKRTG